MPEERTMFWIIRKLYAAAFFLLLMTGITSAYAAEPFACHILDVGQGQSVLFETDSHSILIDGGGRNTSSYVVGYLKQQGVETLDCVAVTHYEEDHMSGVIGVLSAFPCKVLLLPSYAGTGELYQSLAVAALSNGCDILHPAPSFELTIGEALVNVIGPLRADYSSDNDRSLCFKVSFGNTGYLMCGDAQCDSEMDLVNSAEDLSADVYIVNHHGSSTSSNDAFLDRVSPVYAVISCGKDNGYGHPSMETMQRLQNHNVSMFRTDRQGTVILYSDGEEIWSDQEPCDDWSAGGGILSLTTPEGLDAAEGTVRSQTNDPETFQYVCNTNTRKFHDPGCNSVAQMKEENRLYTNLTREELLAEGYEPCGNCRP